MAFVLEDGTGKANANAYASISFADAYFEDRANAAWAAVTDDDAKSAALIKATDYVENRFKFKGTPLLITQALHFPCLNNIPAAGVPTKLKQAVCEYALRALSASLAPDLTVDERGLQVAAKTEKVGPLEESTVYVTTSGVKVFRAYPTADMLLRDLVIGQGRVIRG